MRVVGVSSECFCCERVVRAIWAGTRLYARLELGDATSSWVTERAALAGWAQLPGSAGHSCLNFIPTIHVNIFDDDDHVQDN